MTFLRLGFFREVNFNPQFFARKKKKRLIEGQVNLSPNTLRAEPVLRTKLESLSGYNEILLCLILYVFLHEFIP